LIFECGWRDMLILYKIRSLLCVILSTYFPWHTFLPLQDKRFVV